MNENWKRPERLHGDLPRLAEELRKAVVAFVLDASDIELSEMTPVALALESLDPICSPVAKYWIARAVAGERGRRQVAREALAAGRRPL